MLSSRLTSNSASSCLCLLRAVTAGQSHHFQRELFLLNHWGAGGGSSENSHQDVNISEHLNLLLVEWSTRRSVAHKGRSHAESAHQPVFEASTHIFGALCHCPLLPVLPKKAQLYIPSPRVEARDSEWWHSMEDHGGPCITTVSAYGLRNDFLMGYISRP